MSTRCGLVAVSCLALALLLVEAVGWATWRHAAAVLSTDPLRGARLLGESRLVAQPAAVDASRALAADTLVGVDPELVAAAMSRLGRLQQLWLPIDPSGPKNLARAFLIRGDRAQGMLVLQAAIARDPASPYLHRLMALILRGEGHVAQSLGHLAAARALAPDLRRPEVEVTQQEQEWVELEAARRRVGLHPHRRVEMTLAQAEILHERGRADEAEQVLEPFADQVEVKLQRASWRLDEVLSRPEPPPESRPESRPEHPVQVSGATPRLRGRSGIEGPINGLDAVDLEHIASSRWVPVKQRVRAWTLLAKARAFQGRYEAAVEAADQAHLLAPDSPLGDLTLALLAERQGRLDAAMSHLRRAWGIAPDSVDVLLHVARVAARTGDDDEARYALRRALVLCDESQRSRVAARLAKLLIDGRHYGSALEVLSTALERDPGSAELLALADQLGRQIEAATTRAPGRSVP